MFRPGNLGHLGRLGLVAASRPGLVAQALAILSKYGSAAHLYLPGVGAISGITASNWTEQIGGSAAAVDGAVGMIVGVSGTQYGTELVSNGTFDSGTTGWTTLSDGTITASGGVATITSVSSSTPVYTTITTVPGTRYELRTTVQSLSVGTQGFLVGTAATASNLANAASMITGQRIHYFTATTTTTFLTWSCGAGSRNAVIDNVSVRATGSVPLTQSTAANRPVLRLSSGVYSWQFDGSNDSFTSTLTPGNAGFFCSGANVTDSGVLRTLLGAGAGSDALSGVWLARQVSSNLLMLQVGNGTTRNSIGAPYPVATNAVASAGWDSSAMFVGINGTETSGAKSVDCTSSNTMNLGVLTGTTNPMLGTIGATIIMPTVLPTASERATLRQFIASLSGVTM